MYKATMTYGVCIVFGFLCLLIIFEKKIFLYLKQTLSLFLHKMFFLGVLHKMLAALLYKMKFTCS